MATKETGRGGSESKRFLVQCDSCSFERSATGREDVTQIGNAHRRETGHELVALELPPSIESP